MKQLLLVRWLQWRWCRIFHWFQWEYWGPIYSGRKPDEHGNYIPYDVFICPICGQEQIRKVW